MSEDADFSLSEALIKASLSGRFDPARAAAYADVCCPQDLTDMLGVSRIAVDRWIQRRDMWENNCPLPIRRLTNGRVLYSAQEWREWYAVYSKTRARATWGRRINWDF